MTNKKTRVSDYFRLGKQQPSLDFVDVDIYSDAKLFIDPRALKSLQNEWSEECVFLIQSYFETLLEAIRKGDVRKARELLSALHEPNETHLGLSIGGVHGRGVAGKLSEKLFEALSKSEAVKSGLLVDLEDTILMVEGVAADIVSDIVTNIIRGPLIRYTQRICAENGIPTQRDVASGPTWNPKKKCWDDDHYNELPMANNKRLLLIPKAIVRVKTDYNEDEYYRHYILSHLQGVELSKPGSELIRLVKKTPHVYKKDIEEKYRGDKGMKALIVEETLKSPEILEEYRKNKREKFGPPLNHETLAAILDQETPDWDSLIGKLKSVESGNNGAHDYHMAARDLLTALFYPHLDHPIIEAEINSGLKRIDIKFTNIARTGFFWWVSHNYTAPCVFVECKNYGKEIGNPEIDQLLGRFSKSRGEFGILVCRKIQDRKRCTERCRKIADDQAKYILVLDDEDLEKITKQLAGGGNPFESAGLLHEKFNELIM